MDINYWLLFYLLLTVGGWIIIFTRKGSDLEDRLMMFFANVFMLALLWFGGAFDGLVH